MTLKKSKKWIVMVVVAYHMIMKLTICDLKEFNSLLMRLFLSLQYLCKNEYNSVVLVCLNGTTFILDS